LLGRRVVQQRYPKPTTIDCETFGIEGRPSYPPDIVGVAIKKWGKKSKYYAFNHQNGKNNCTREDAVAAVREAYDTAKDGLLFHSAKFDLDCIETHFGIAPPPWDKWHDSVFALYLDDPHARDFGLKPSAERLLGMAPDERDTVADWLTTEQPVEGVRIGRGANSKHPPGKYIAYAPPEVVGPYANGDVVRTEALFEKLYPSIVARGMLPAYDRERRLMPALLDMERRGVPVDVARLRADVAKYRGVMGRLETWLRKRLGIGPDVNLDSDQQLCAALLSVGAADPALMGITKTGKVKMDKAALAAGVADLPLAAVLRYLTQIKTCLGTFMESWLETAEASGGLIFTSWNQTRGGAKGGTRTGRLSSSPNFQNIPKEFAPIFLGDDPTEKKLPRCPIKDLPALPLCRSYITPFPGHVLVGRDYQGQELRVLAHYEDRDLLARYREDPWLDPHEYARQMINQMLHRNYARKPIKNLGFQIIYGGGATAIAARLDITYEAAEELKKAYLKVLPGIKSIYDDMRARAVAEQPFLTWGCREYSCEDPIIHNGRVLKFDYKMTNYLIQGSSADATKEALVRFSAVIDPSWRIILQVHDELVLSVPIKDLAIAHERLRDVMVSLEFDVPMHSEGAFSEVNWGSMETFDEKGVVIWRKPTEGDE
jgi:DNA polymerase I-like protein with 3'-5' exonuclease and polymerase domains